MTDNILNFTGDSTVDVSMDQVMDQASLDADHDRIGIVVYYDDDGDICIASTCGNYHKVHWEMVKAARSFMNALEDRDE